MRALARSGRGREIRLAAGLSLNEIGDAIGVAGATVQRWEIGIHKPYGEAAHRYGALLDGLARLTSRDEGSP